MKIYTSFLAVIAVLLLTFSACLQPDHAYKLMAPGIWRGFFILDKTVLPAAERGDDNIDLVHDQIRPGELPFNFEVIYTSPEKFYVEFINGDERIRCDSIRYGRDRTTARDTYNFYFPEYQTYLHSEVRGSGMQGYWCVTTKDNYRIPFYADAGKAFRFTTLKVLPEFDMTGKWPTLFGVDKNDPEKAIGEFKQEGNRLTGTFRTETGDYRFLEGTVQGRKFWLSGFDGAHAFLFSGVITRDSLQGEFRSGKNPPTLWTSWHSGTFDLGSPDTLTQLVNGKNLSFSLTTPNGKTLNYPGPEFDNKITIVTISGTWCPNCRDEQVFLRDFLKENPALAAEMKIVTASFERHKEPAAAHAQLAQYAKTLGLTHDVVYAGKASRDEAAAVFPVLNKVMAFPTMMIIDKKGKIQKVHTGFDGPATSKYPEFKAGFTQLIQSLR